MYLGRYRIGEYVTLAVWCRNAAGVPTVPDIAPTMIVYDEDDSLITTKIPVCDKHYVTGFFLKNLYLNSKFSIGGVRIVYQYALSSVQFTDEDLFEIVAGGNDNGVGISSYYFRRPQQNFTLVQGESGRLLKKRNAQP